MNVKGSLRDGFGVRVDIELEDIGTVVHQCLDPFVQVGHFVEAHLKHYSTEGFTSIPSFLVEELANDYRSAKEPTRCRIVSLRKSLEMYTKPERTEVLPAGCSK